MFTIDLTEHRSVHIDSHRLHTQHKRHSNHELGSRSDVVYTIDRSASAAPCGETLALCSAGMGCNTVLFAGSCY